MILLILGLILWYAAHLFRRLAPAARAKTGDKARAPIAIAILVSVVFMVLGYRSAPVDPLYTPIAGIGHLSVLLMIVALYLFGMAPSKGILSNKVRHPMLIGMVVWASAHLLVNGDVASALLFGGLGVWALIQMSLINLAEGRWDRPPAGSAKGDIKNLVITLILFGIITAIHIITGHNPFVGTYG